MMNELQETIKSICDDFADISAILAAVLVSLTEGLLLMKR